MLEHILGWLTLSLIFLFIILKVKDPDILKILVVAFALRAILVILDQYFFALPGGTLDAKGYVIKALNISNEYGLNILFNMFQHDGFFISRIISIFFTLTAKSEMMAQGISVALGTASVYLVYQLSLLIWNKDASIKGAWIMSLHPSMILFSALVLKEAYATFFLLLTLLPIIFLITKLNVTKFIKVKNKKNHLLNNNLFLILFILSGFFIVKNIHGGLYVGIFILLIYLLYYLFKNELDNLKKGKITIVFIITLSIAIVLFIFWYFELVLIPYIPGPGEILNLYDILIRRFNIGTISLLNGVYGSSFPSLAVPTNMIDFLPKVSARIIYFLYSPFPWDIKRYDHLLGLIDSIIMIYLTICAWNNRKVILGNPITKFLLILLISYIVLYAIGTNNFGTAIRHKTKFIFILIFLAAPKLVKISFVFKK